MSDPDKPRRHAPKGRIKAQPMELNQPMVRCKATNRQGNRCGKPPIPGGVVCRMHGGASPQVKQKALERLMTLQHPAIARLEQLMAQAEFPSVAIAAVKDVLDRTMGKAAEHVDVTLKKLDDVTDAELAEKMALLQQKLLKP